MENRTKVTTDDRARASFCIDSRTSSACTAPAVRPCGARRGEAAEVPLFPAPRQSVSREIDPESATASRRPVMAGCAALLRPCRPDAARAQCAWGRSSPRGPRLLGGAGPLPVKD